MTTYLVSYADGRLVHRRNQRALARSAAGKGIDVVLEYGRQDLSLEFQREHRHILDRRRGAGSWLWKPSWCAMPWPAPARATSSSTRTPASSSSGRWRR